MAARYEAIRSPNTPGTLARRGVTADAYARRLIVEQANLTLPYLTSLPSPSLTRPCKMVMPASMSLRVALLAVIAGTTPFLTEAQGGTDSTRADSVSRRLRPVTVTESRAAAVVGGASALIVTTDKLRSSPAPLLDQLLRETPSVSVRQEFAGRDGTHRARV